MRGDKLWMGAGLVVCLMAATALWVTGGCGAGASGGGTDGTVIPGPHSIGDGPAGDQNDNSGGAGDNSNDNGGGINANDNGAGSANDNGGGLGGMDACTAVNGRAFFTPSASLSFVDGTFIWTVSDLQVMGTFTCAGLDLAGSTTEGDTITGSYDPLLDVVVWGSAIYRPHTSP
jgi:hypothetical protein